MSSLPIPDYDELQRSLLAAESVSASEAHGIITGVLCAPKPSAEALARTVLVDIDPAADTRDIERYLGMLRAYTEERLRARESDFEPVLPDEDRSLTERVEALAEFCRGFLMGLVAGGVQDFSALPGDAREVVDDFVQIAEAETGDLATDGGEQAFTEIAEYVRVGVQVVYEELHPA